MLSSFAETGILLQQMNMKVYEAQKTAENLFGKYADSGFEYPDLLLLFQFFVLGTTLTNQNDIHDEIKSRLNPGNACYYSVQSLLSSHLISKTLKIKIYKTVILPVVLYGCETWSLTLGEEHRLRVLENSVLRKMDCEENCIMMNFTACILH
jgi:hypothetical protein